MTNCKLDVPHHQQTAIMSFCRKH